MDFSSSGLPIFLLIAVILLVVVVAAYAIGSYTSKSSPTGTGTPAGFSSYSNANVSFDYPNTWSVETNYPVPKQLGSSRNSPGVLAISVLGLVPSSLANENVSTLASCFAETYLAIFKTNSSQTANATALILAAFLSLPLTLSNGTNHHFYNTTSPYLTKGIEEYGTNISSLKNSLNETVSEPNLFGFVSGYSGSTAFFAFGVASCQSYIQQEIIVLDELSQTLGS